MLSDERALLSAIDHQPQDQAPRLVYADWLDEQGRSEMAKDIRNLVAGRLSKRSYRRLLYAMAAVSRQGHRRAGGRNDWFIVLVRASNREPGSHWVYYCTPEQAEAARSYGERSTWSRYSLSNLTLFWDRAFAFPE
jgi:uncharacterized protein (TIGR02996 family)